MLKSALVLAIAALVMNSTRAVWALMAICLLSVAATWHVTTIEGLTLAEATLVLFVLDVVGSFTYVVGVAVSD